jgi:hypothetical protein
MKNALKSLKESGLIVKKRTNNKPAIIGGTESTECGGIILYQNAFSISYEPNEWIIELPGKGQIVVTEKASTLEEAIRIVCNYFNQPSKKRSIFIPS